VEARLRVDSAIEALMQVWGQRGVLFFFATEGRQRQVS